MDAYNGCLDPRQSLDAEDADSRKNFAAVARENGCNLLVNNAGVDRTRFPEVCLEVSTTNTQSWGKEHTIVNFTT
jgi:short-subunit dehydrogenase involved in D-alanine esterification of teichoic acids